MIFKWNKTSHPQTASAIGELIEARYGYLSIEILQTWCTQSRAMTAKARSRRYNVKRWLAQTPKKAVLSSFWRRE